MKFCEWVSITFWMPLPGNVSFAPVERRRCASGFGTCDGYATRDNVSVHQLIKWSASHMWPPHRQSCEAAFYCSFIALLFPPCCLLQSVQMPSPANFSFCNVAHSFHLLRIPFHKNLWESWMDLGRNRALPESQIVPLVNGIQVKPEKFKPYLNCAVADEYFRLQWFVNSGIQYRFNRNK